MRKVDLSALEVFKAVVDEGGVAKAAAKDLRARGVNVDAEVRSRRGAWGVGPSIYIRDPDGYQIELKPRG